MEHHSPALLLRRIPFSETSLILHLMSEGHGKIALMAKGARRANSPMRGALEPLYDLSIRWRAGRTGMGTLTSVERGTFLVPDQQIVHGLELLAISNQLFKESDPHGYPLIHQALEILQQQRGETGAAAAIWALLQGVGLIGDMGHCWQCGSESSTIFWADNEARCPLCTSNQRRELPALLRAAMNHPHDSPPFATDVASTTLWLTLCGEILAHHHIQAGTLFRRNDVSWRQH